MAIDNTESRLSVASCNKSKGTYMAGLAKEYNVQITDIRIRRVASGGKLKAYVTITFDDSFVVHNIKVIEGKSGVFIAMPSRRTKTGDYKDIAHPIHSDFREALQAQILDAYKQLPEDSDFIAEEELEA
jgi:stage V sporulation protein G